MNDRKVFFGSWVITAVYVMLMLACGSTPGANLPDEMLLTVRGIQCVSDFPDGLSGSNPRTGTTTAPDGQTALYFEDGKNKERDGDDRWTVVVCDIRPGNFKGYTRMAVDIAADSSDLLLDTERFFIRVRDLDLNWYDYHRNNQWNNLVNAVEDDPGVFRTLEWDIEDPNTMGFDFDYRRLFDIWLVFIGGPDNIPGKIYTRNLRFLK